MIRPVAFGLLLTALLCFAGCEPKSRLGGGAQLSDPDAPSWWPRPVGLRVFPSTRFIREGQEVFLEARIELADDLGDSIKAPADFYFDLHSGPQGASTPRLLFSWQQTVRTREDQINFYDPVTRAYLFRLKVQDVSNIRDQARLTVTVVPEGMTRLTAAADISRE